MPQRPIRSIIEKRKVLTAPPTTTVVEAARLMQKHHVSAVMVVEDERLVGIFTERDAMFRVIAEVRNPKSTQIGSVMTANPRTIDADRPFAHALLLMHDGGFRHLPVVANGRPVGMVSARDALGLEWNEFESELARRERIGESLG